jgi:hypothetical protein
MEKLKNRGKANEKEIQLEKIYIGGSKYNKNDNDQINYASTKR